MAATHGLPCFQCLAAHTPTHKRCAGCHVATYCSKECQRKSWTEGHRYECACCRTRVKYNDYTGHGMYMEYDAEAGALVWKEGMMAGVEYQKTPEDTCKMLGEVLGHHYKGWEDCGLTMSSCAQVTSTDGMSEEEAAAFVNEVAAMNVCQPNTYNRSLGGGNLTHQGFFIGGCFFNASRTPNAESMVCLDGDRLVLRVVLHEDLKKGDQVFLGYTFDGECRCDMCLAGRSCSARVLSVQETSRRMAINLGVAELFDEEIYLRLIMQMGEGLRRMQEFLEPDQLAKWMEDNKASMSHLLRMTKQVMAEQAATPPES